MSSLAKKLIAQNRRTRSTFLDLGDCGIRKLPAEIGDLVWLESLSLSGYWSEWSGGNWNAEASQNKGEPNSFTDLSPICRLHNLKAIFLRRTPITDLNPIRHLPALQTLDCSDTKITELAPIQNLAALQSL